MAKMQAGSDVDAYCGRCKLVLAHVVVAMGSARPAQVQCKTCTGTHAYRSDVPRRAVAKTSGGRRTVEAANQAEYERLMQGRDVSRAVRYNANTLFSEEDVVDHSNFGLGLVKRVLSGNKIEVHFPSGPKVLVHGR